MNLSVHISAMKMRGLVFNISYKFRFSWKSHLYFSSVSFAHEHIIAYLDLQKYIYSSKWERGFAYELVRGSPVYVGMSVNIGGEEKWG